MLIKSITRAVGILIALIFILSPVASVYAIRGNPTQLLYGKYAVGNEIIELRTENSKTKWLGGNRYSTEISLGAIHYKDNYSNSSEQWKDIDLTFVNNQITKAPYILTVNPDTYSLTMYDKRTGSTASLALLSIGGKSCGKVTKSDSKGKMTFSNVATDTDIEVVADNTRVQFKRILKSVNAPVEAIFGLSQIGTGITVTSEARYVDSADMADARIPVIASKSGGLLTETIDKSKVTKYSVEIDPTLNIAVTASTDDCNKYWSTNAWIFGTASVALAVGYQTATVNKHGLGLRFLNVTIPKDAPITAAYLICKSRANTAEVTVRSKISLWNGDDATTFSDVTDFDAKFAAKTSQVTWSITDAWTTDSNYNSPSIVTPVQTVVNRAGWVSGNDMIVFWEDFEGLSDTDADYHDRRTYSYDLDTAKTNILHIEYTPPAPTVVITKACTGFSTNWAVVNGEVINAYGATITQRGFDYGLTTTYGSENLETGSWSEMLYSAYLSSLSPATVYHYRAKVLLGATWYYGTDMTFSTKGSPTLYEANTAASTGDSYITNSANWTYQTFTTNMTNVGHTVSSIWLYLRRVGSPGTVTVGIRYTANLTTAPCILAPTGDDIVTGYLDGNTFSTVYTWYKLDVTEKCLSANTTYAIVVRAQAGNASNYILWGSVVAGTYAGGNAGYSINSGTIWTAQCATDYLFQIWGNPCLYVENAKVFTSYLQSNDWLVTLLYKNIYEPYYTDGTDVASIFYIQLANTSGTVLAQTKCPAWGYRPGCIYLNAGQVTSLEWGYAYRVRVYGDFADYPYMEYVLQPADWMGSDLNRLDSWVMSTATLIENYYGATITTYIANKGLVLNEDGGVIFDTGIPALSSVRPDIFQIVSTTPGYTQEDFTGALQTEHVWQVLLGPFVTSLFTGWGNIWNISGSTVGAFLAFTFYSVVAIFAFPIGSAAAAISIPFGIMLLAWYTGLIPMAALGVILALASFWFIWQTWLKGG